MDIKYGHIRPKQPAPKCILSNSTQVCVNVCLYMDLYIPPYRINNEKIFTPTKEAVLKQPRTVKSRAIDIAAKCRMFTTFVLSPRELFDPVPLIS